MIDKYLSPAQVAEIISCSKRKAYDIIYQLPHLPSPIRVSERILKQWIDDSMVYPERRRRSA